MGKKLYVGNLSPDTSSDDLKALFSTVGPCESASIITDRVTGRPRGFGFVEMSSTEGVQKAIATLNGHELHGRKMIVSEAREREGGARPRGGGGGFHRR